MNRFKRLFFSVMIAVLPGRTRISFIKRHHLYGSIGDNCYIQKRKLPLYSNLVFIHNNVHVASNVGFVTHDIIHSMLNVKFEEGGFVERIGCIEIMDNVFIGSGTRILYDTRIGNNVIIGSDSLVNKDVPDNSVYAGVPARYICSFEEYVAKAKQYSECFKEQYGNEIIHGVDDKLSKRLYDAFLKKKNK